MSRYNFVRELCERWGVSEHTVLNLIHNGELKAVNLARSPTGKKPRWRITEQAIVEFEAKRTPRPPPPRAKGRKRPADVIVFYQ
jgi:excisionase family DNA binding protein